MDLASFAAGCVAGALALACAEVLGVRAIWRAMMAPRPARPAPLAESAEQRLT